MRSERLCGPAPSRVDAGAAATLKQSFDSPGPLLVAGVILFESTTFFNHSIQPFTVSKLLKQQEGERTFLF